MSGREDREIVMSTEGENSPQLALVLQVSLVGPIVSHIQQSKTLINKELPIVGASEFPFQYRPNSACFTNKVRPDTYTGKVEAAVILLTSIVRRSDRDTWWMIRGLAGHRKLPIIKREAAIAKGAPNSRGITGESL
jgi:hypothetical protein